MPFLLVVYIRHIIRCKLCAFAHVAVDCGLPLCVHKAADETAHRNFMPQSSYICRNLDEWGMLSWIQDELSCFCALHPPNLALHITLGASHCNATIFALSSTAGGTQLPSLTRAMSGLSLHHCPMHPTVAAKA